MKEKYLEQEKQYMIETVMKKKNINQEQIDEHIKQMNEKIYDEGYIEKIRSDADKNYKDEVSKLFSRIDKHDVVIIIFHLYF